MLQLYIRFDRHLVGHKALHEHGPTGRAGKGDGITARALEALLFRALGDPKLTD